MKLKKLPKELLPGMVIIKKSSGELKTEAGIILSETTHKSDKLTTGKVLMKASDVEEVSVGDMVLIHNYLGDEFKVGEDDVVMWTVKGLIYAIL